MKVVLVRHGEIDSNRRQIYSGRSDEPLNDNGIAQARAAAEVLCGMPLSGLFTSPLLRTKQTAGIIGERISHVPVVADEFNELRMGPWQGLSETEVAERYPAEFALWNGRPADLRLDGRETLEDIQERALAGIRRLGRAVNGGDIAVVSHVAVIRILILHADGRPLNDYKKVHVPNAAPLVLDWSLDA